jgi:hypothetical protein
MFKNSSLKIRDNAVLAINKLKSKVQRDTRVSIDKILTANNLIKNGNIMVEGAMKKNPAIDNNPEVKEAKMSGKEKKHYASLMRIALAGRKANPDFTSSIASNGDFVVSDRGNVVARLKKGTFKYFHQMKESVESTDMQEALNVQQRMKLKQSMRRNKAKIAMGRKRAARKLASPEKLQKRAEKAARTAMVKKILKDKDKSDLSYAARKGIEDRLAKKKGQIKTMAKKLLKTVRLKDRAKLQKKPGA